MSRIAKPREDLANLRQLWLLRDIRSFLIGVVYSAIVCVVLYGFEIASIPTTFYIELLTSGRHCSSLESTLDVHRRDVLSRAGYR